MNSVSTVTNASAAQARRRARQASAVVAISGGGREFRRGADAACAGFYTSPAADAKSCPTRGLTCPARRGLSAAPRSSRDTTRCTPIAPIPAARLRAADAGQPARLSGWVHAKRDHGGLLFIDLRDHYGITQCVFAAGSPAFAAADAVRPESVITVTGQVVPREPGTVNPKLPTGEIELRVDRPGRAVRRRGAADPGRRRGEIPRGAAPEIPLPRPAARQAAPQHDAARRGDRLDPPAHDRGRASPSSRRRS